MRLNSVAIIFLVAFASCGKAPAPTMVAQADSVRCGDRPTCFDACEKLCTGMGESGGGFGCETQKNTCKNSPVDPGKWP